MGFFEDNGQADGANEEVFELFDYQEALYGEAYGMAEEVLDPGNAPNEGAAALMENYIQPAGMEVVEGWEDGWPFSASGSEFLDACLSAHEGAEACFGASIAEAADEIQSIITEARVTGVFMQLLGAFV